MFKGLDILVTGGTGSFGKHFIKTVLANHRPQRLIIFSRDELKQHEMRQAGFDDPCLRYFIGDVRDLDRLRRGMAGVDVVIHAAALKQVPACEYNPSEAVKTNVDGSQNVVDAAIDTGVSKVLALSTDKAVSPVNLYGATKLCAEKLMVQGNSYSGSGGPRFCCTRYGNVMGSRGSVVPVFQRQRASGKITVTDARMTRFWLTLDQGVKFVISCLEQMQGGEIFVPKLASMRVLDLAKAIAPECDVQYTGIRPGEKLHETLLSVDEARQSLELEDRYIIQPTYPWWNNGSYDRGTTLPDGFVYTSDANDQSFAFDELREMLGGEDALSRAGDRGGHPGPKREAA